MLVFAVAHLLGGCGCCDEHHAHHHDCGPYFVPFGIYPYNGCHHHGGYRHHGHHHHGGF